LPSLGAVAVSVAAAIGLTLVVSGLTLARDPQPITPDEAIEALIPGPGELALRQAEIGVDMAPGWLAALQVDGAEIPEDQLTVTEELGRFLYRPGSGTETGALAPGRHTVTVVYWPDTATRESSAKTYSWSFIAS
jgi:hypothetical protein